ncbi:TPA: hypothetical protein DD449_03935 [Candidatus Berkelbacteria bacterium]|uniref:Uncharacterized protein n=1 Tax=Berkelbacteria bacterium GW2011_GWE1_39_12 TaxID=1618337 RepID=A0A0G4B319_9BACT|nr:MAG: hypothetical protein UT28_C0001G0423 [Berkelbacteria bacterium GW2011_GWE1_39_12]HBO60807.1 hypothetical protein [Candidatus Berkelbacteria bacterium]
MAENEDVIKEDDYIEYKEQDYPDGHQPHRGHWATEANWEDDPRDPYRWPKHVGFWDERANW